MPRLAKWLGDAMEGLMGSKIPLMKVMEIKYISKKEPTSISVLFRIGRRKSKYTSAFGIGELSGVFQKRHV